MFIRLLYFIFLSFPVLAQEGRYPSNDASASSQGDVLGAVTIYNSGYKNFSKVFEGRSDVLTSSLLKKLVQEKNIKSVTELLIKLKEEYPDFLEGVVAMEHTGSIQRKGKRLIFHGTSGQIQIAFDESSNEVEIGEFVFLEKEGKKQKVFQLFELSFDRQNVGQFEKNPGKCIECHGEPSRPLWSGYSTWHGAFGEDDDRVIYYNPFDNTPNPHAEEKFRKNRDNV